MKFFNSHLSTEKIADAIENRLSANEIDSFEAHLEGCQDCANEYKALEHSIGLMRRDDAKDAPAEALKFAFDLFRTRKQLVPREQTVAQKILATLKLDVSPFSPVFGERSAAASAERQMLFDAGDFDVDLRIQGGENGFNLAGQILGELSDRNSIRLENKEGKFEATISALGEFEFKNVPTGIYDLTLLLGDSEIVVEDLIIE
jgi:hypothetical protein